VKGNIDLISPMIIDFWRRVFMNKLGMHIHGLQPGILEAVALLQPRTVTIMDPKPEDIQAIRDVSPGTFVVARKYEDGRAWQEMAPHVWAEMNYDMCGGLADGVVGWNEPFGHDDWGSCQPFDEWSYVFTSACRKLGNMEAVVLCMATGNWTGADDRYKVTDDFPLTCAHARYFGPHEYSWPDLQAGAGWYALRFKAWLEDIGRDDVRIILTEAGLTQAIIYGRDDVGWKSGGPEGVTEDSYIATLAWYNQELCKVPQCLGCCLFDYAGDWYGWPTFEQLGLENRIYQIQAPETPEPPSNGGETMIKVYDFDGVERDWAWLIATFGDIQVHPIEDKIAVSPGDHVYKVCYIRAKRSDAACQINARDVSGNPVVGETIIFGWPDAELHGYADKPSNWTENGIAGDTNETGDVGPGMGTGGYYNPAEGERGPHFCWVWDKPSDYVDGIGMLTLTNHDHPDIGYQEVVWGEEEPEPPSPEPGEPGEALLIVAAIRGLLDQLEIILLGLDATTESMAQQLRDLI